MIRICTCLAAAAMLAAASPALALGPPTKHCTASIKGGGQSLFAEVTRPEGQALRSSLQFRLPIISSAAPGGRLLAESELSAALPYGAVNGQVAIRLMPVRDLTGYPATLVVGDGWALVDLTLVLPMADIGKADRVAHLRVIAGNQTIWFGHKLRLDLADGVAPGVVRPGLSAVGIGGDAPKLVAALRKVPEAELQAIDKDGKVLISAKFRTDRVDTLFGKGRETVELLEMAIGMSGPCDADDVDLDA